MKIHQLPLGARFEYQGEEFVKTGPMFGTAKTGGGQRLIPKYAQLNVLGESSPVREGKARQLPAAEVLEAFAAFYAVCGQLVPEDQHSKLWAAREHFMKALGQAR